MIKTRFDETDAWQTALGEWVAIKDLEIDHMLNILAMFEKKPGLIQNLLLKDVVGRNNNVWQIAAEAVKESVYNVTSMKNDELKTYWKNCPLYKTMVDELFNRGVNVLQVLNNITEELNK